MLSDTTGLTLTTHVDHIELRVHPSPKQKTQHNDEATGTCWQIPRTFVCMPYERHIHIDDDRPSFHSSQAARQPVPYTVPTPLPTLGPTPVQAY